MVILLAYMGKYLILSLKKYIADRIIEAQTKQFIVTITPNRKCSSVFRGGQLTSFLLNSTSMDESKMAKMGP